MSDINADESKREVYTQDSDLAFWEMDYASGLLHVETNDGCQHNIALEHIVSMCLVPESKPKIKLVLSTHEAPLIGIEELASGHDMVSAWKSYRLEQMSKLD